jgi:peptidoglycan hydrolase-like protein with peptidoglycan-binding domain
MRTMGDDTIPAEFLEPEGDGERQDPNLTLEATSSALREMWKDWMCRKGGGSYTDVQFFGRTIGGVPAPAADAYRALEQALQSSGYVPRSCWAYNCRLIAGTDSYSLHSAGIAVDIDPTENPYTDGDAFAGKFRPEHVAAAMAIRNTKGARLWSWGGHWSKPDRMHFQLDQSPTAAAVDWASVPGGKPDDVDGESQAQLADIEEDEMTLAKGTKGPAVKQFQECLLAWNPRALPEDGADAIFGAETTVWVRRFQEAFGLEKTGTIDGVTAAMLAMQHK